MWTSNDSKAQSDRDQAQPAATVVEIPGAASRAASLPAQNQYSMIGKSIVIKGEITATDPVYVYGCVEGSISAPAHRVTVGREGKVKADIHAREVVIMGAVLGAVDGSERVELRSDGSLEGDLTTRRVYIEDGAILSGFIDVSRPAETKKVETEAKVEPTLEETGPEGETWADLAVSEIA